MAQIATLAYIIFIVGLFWLNRETEVRTSRALWLPVIWLLINSSRPVTVWLHISPPNVADSMYLDGSPIDRNIYLMLVLAAVFVLCQRPTNVKRVLADNPVVLVFFGYCLISCLWADHPDVAFKRWIKAVGDLAMVLIVLTDKDRLDAVKRLLARVGFILVPVSILLIKYYPDMARYYSRWEGRMFVSGVAEDKNMLGMVCLIFGLGAWWRLVSAFREYQGPKRIQIVLAQIAVLSMVGWLFWMANSMTSLSCFLMAGTVLAATHLFRFARKPLVVLFLVLTVIGTSFSVLFLNIGGGALKTMGRNPTLTGRTEIWQGLLSIDTNPIIGTGFQSFWVGENLRQVWSKGGLLGGINESHNGYLEIFLNLGGIGLAILLALLIVGCINITKQVRQDPGLGPLCVGFFVIAVIYAFTEASAFGIMNPVWYAMLIAIIRLPKSAGVPCSPCRGQDSEVTPAKPKMEEGWWGNSPQVPSFSPSGDF
jgi:O-antigen ligase